MKTYFTKRQNRYLLAQMIFLLASKLLVAQSVYPTGVTVYNPQKAYNSFVLFGTFDKKSYLIDMNGNVVHEWNYAGFPSEILDPAVNKNKKGDILVQYDFISGENTAATPGKLSIFSNKTIAELDWQGNVVWKWGDNAPGGTARQHHDWQRLENGNTLILANQAGAIPGFKLHKLLDDVIYEVNPQGDIVWIWKASEHLDEFGFTAEQLQLLKNVESEDYLHVNNMSTLGPNKWFDSGDKRFDPQNIIIDSRNANFIVIIDKKTGKVVWNLGPNFPTIKGDGKKLPKPIDQISGQHDAHLIEKGFPGEGNLIVFDNQGEAGYPRVPLKGGSRILEINPVTKEIVWEYTGENSGRPKWTFFSSFISSARRLPNGNTLIDEGMHGRFFQITPQGEIVWEYVNPYFNNTNLQGGKEALFSNAVYRAQPIPYEWVPDGTPHQEKKVTTPDITKYRVQEVRQ